MIGAASCTRHTQPLCRTPTSTALNYSAHQFCVPVVKFSPAVQNRYSSGKQPALPGWLCPPEMKNFIHKWENSFHVHYMNGRKVLFRITLQDLELSEEDALEQGSYQFAFMRFTYWNLLPLQFCICVCVMPKQLRVLTEVKGFSLYPLVSTLDRGKSGAFIVLWSQNLSRSFQQRRCCRESLLAAKLKGTLGQGENCIRLRQMAIFLIYYI